MMHHASYPPVFFLPVWYDRGTNMTRLYTELSTLGAQEFVISTYPMSAAFVCPPSFERPELGVCLKDADKVEPLHPSADLGRRQQYCPYRLRSRLLRTETCLSSFYAKYQYSTRGWQHACPCRPELLTRAHN
jgi:hypothetical protein